MLLSPSDQARLTADFAKLTRPVRLVFVTQTFDCDTCDQTRRILAELTALSAQITVDEVNLVLEADRARQYGIDRAPAIALVTTGEAGQDRDSRIRFLGTPSGYEFISLVRAILLVGGGEPALSAGSLARLTAIERPTTVHVFTTPTCPHCPRAVTLAHEIAWASPHVTAYAVEATEYPDLARRYHVTGVPKTVINDRVEILGAVPEDEFVEQAVAGAAGADAPGQAQ